MIGQHQWHEWGVIAQTKNPYREFVYCPKCRWFREQGVDEKRMTRRQFNALLDSLRTTNPMFVPDSCILLPRY